MIIIQSIARVIGLHKMYGLIGLNYNQLDDVTPVPDRRTEIGKYGIILVNENP